MSLLEKCCKCLGNGRTEVYNPKALLNQCQFKNVDKRVFCSTTLIFPFFFLFCAVSPSRYHKQKQSSGHNGVCCTNSQLMQGHSMFPLASTCSIHQHGDSFPSEAEQLQSSQGVVLLHVLDASCTSQVLLLLALLHCRVFLD